MSQFPATPLTENGPSGSSIYSYGSEASSPYPYMNSAQPSFPPGSNANAFDDEYDDGVSYEPTESGRSTPSTMARRTGPNTRSLPVEQREVLSSRPRAQTEDSSSAVINQWRNQTPGSSQGPPSLPRGASHASNGSESQSLRSSASSRQLTSKQSSEWGGNSPAMSYGRLPGAVEEETTPKQGVPRQTSHGQVPTHGQAPPMLRNRSASSPNMYQGPGFPPAVSSPQLSEQEWASYQHGGSAASRHPYAQYSANGAPVGNGSQSASSRQALHKSSGTNSGGTLASASSASTNKKRFSSSSNGTDRSSATSNQSLGQSYSASSPSTGLPPSGSLPSLPSSSAYGQQHQGNGFPRSTSSRLSNNLPPLPNAQPPLSSSAVRVKVTFGEDTFVVVVLATVSHRELVDKVLKKIRLCGRSGVEASSLRLRYQDEDGDKILITSEEDVQMAFEAVRVMSPVGGGQPPTLAVFATVDPGSIA